MNLPLHIAKRYLFAKKSHNVVNLVSYISMIGIVCGTAALIVIISVFNGFEDLTKSLYTVFNPDYKISPIKGKTFIVDSAVMLSLSNIPEIKNISLTLEENVLLKYKDRQTLSVMKGIDDTFEDNTKLKNAILAGNFSTSFNEDFSSAVIGNSSAAELGLYYINESPLDIYVPKQGARLTNNPMESLHTMRLYVSGVFALEKSFDNRIFVSLDFARFLLEKPNEASAIEIRVDSSKNLSTLSKSLSNIVGADMKVENRYQQNPSLYRMMHTEKIVTYFILLFVILILSFNISGSLSMLILEKKADAGVLESMGANTKLVRSIFLYEGLLITFFGIIIGLILGLTLCYVQIIFQPLKLPGASLLINAYPVSVRIQDVIISTVSVFIIGFAASWYSISRIR